MQRLPSKIAEVAVSAADADGVDPLDKLTLGQRTMDRIGNTPLLRMARIVHDLPGIEILGKAESNIRAGRTLHLNAHVS